MLCELPPKIQIAEAPISALADHARISTAFQVDRVFDVEAQAGGTKRFVLHERRPVFPYVKDYDAIDGQSPSSWPGRFNLSHWGLITARAAGEYIGGAVIAPDTTTSTVPDSRTNLAVLWDIRVSPEFRRHGVGSALFRAAESWAAARGFRQLRVETQNINVPACAFYAKCGCDLREINRAAYPEFPEEIQLIWCKDLVM
jgi:GNAT superfamily N-acetyltransferase